MVLLHGGENDSDIRLHQEPSFEDDANYHRLGCGTSFPILCAADRTEMTPFARSFHLSVSQIPNLPQHRAYMPKPGPPWPWPLGVSPTPSDNGCDRTAKGYSPWRNLRGVRSEQCVVPPFHLQTTLSPAPHSCTDIIIHDRENQVFSLQDRVHSSDDRRADSCDIGTQDGSRTTIGEDRQPAPSHSFVYPNCRLQALLTNARQRLHSSFPDVTQKHQKAHPLPTRYLETELCNNDRSRDHLQLLVSSDTGSLGQLPKLQRIALHPSSEEPDLREQPPELRCSNSSENFTDDQAPVAEVDGDNVVCASRVPPSRADAKMDEVKMGTSDDAFCKSSRKHLPEHDGHCEILTVDCSSSSDARSSRSRTPTPNNVSNSKDAVADSAGVVLHGNDTQTG